MADKRAAALANPAFAERVWQKGKTPNPKGAGKGSEKTLRVVEPEFTHLRKQKFLAQLRRKPDLSEAAKWAGVSRLTVEKARIEDHELDELIKEAMLAHSDRVESEMFRRAYEGDRELLLSFGKPVTDKDGNMLYRAPRYDQRAAETVLQRYKPEFRSALNRAETPGTKQPVELANARNTVARELDRIAERLSGGKARAIAAPRKSGGSSEADSE
jgi:hypothetical protein